MNKNIVKVLAILVLVCTFGTLMVSCKKDPVLNDYKLGLGVTVSLESSKTGTAQVDATAATVVTDKDGKIVLCRIDVAQNKVPIANGVATIPAEFKTKMELGDAYGMAGKVDNNGDGVMKEWYEQVKAFETYVVGKTAAEVEGIATEFVNGHYIAKDEALLTAGCTIQITDFISAVVKACKDDQAVSFKSEGNFTLGVALNSYNDGTKDATADATGTVQVYSDIAASVVEGGKIVASINDAIQPKIIFNAAGEITDKKFSDTKRVLKGGYGMAGKVDNNGDGVMKEWFEQSAAFSSFVVGKTAAEVKALETQAANGHDIAKDDALLTAGCTIQITGIKAVVAESVENAR